MKIVSGSWYWKDAFWAKQDPIAITFYSIVLKANGGIGVVPESYQTTAGAFTLPPSTFDQEGYAFNGWNTVADGSGISYADCQPITITSNITLFAQWMPIETSGFNSSKVKIFTLYPNPTTDMLHVQIEESISKIDVWSVSGRMLLQSLNSNYIDVSGLSQGNYLVRIQTANGVATQKFIKE